MPENQNDATRIDDDLARLTAANCHDATRTITQGLNFDLEPASFLVALDELALDEDEGTNDGQPS